MGLLVCADVGLLIFWFWISLRTPNPKKLKGGRGQVAYLKGREGLPEVCGPLLHLRERGQQDGERHMVGADGRSVGCDRSVRGRGTCSDTDDSGRRRSGRAMGLQWDFRVLGAN